jgi:hypothetical protein
VVSVVFKWKSRLKFAILSRICTTIPR